MKTLSAPSSPTLDLKTGGLGRETGDHGVMAEGGEGK
jgi:hypothetical protein